VKIGFVTTSDISRVNGYTTRLLSEIEQLVHQGIPVSVIGFLHVKHYRNAGGISRHAKSVRDLGSRITIVPVPPDNQSRALYAILDRFQSWSIRRYIEQEGISILHCEDSLAAYLAVLAARSVGVPVVYDMHGSSVAEHRDYLKRDSAALKRVVYTEETAVRGATAIIAVSHSLQARWRKEYPAASPVSQVIPCAVDTEGFRFMPRERERLRHLWGVDRGVPVFAYLGTAEAYQKIDEALEVFSALRQRFPRARMIFVSPQVDVPIVQRIADARGVTKEALVYCSLPHAEVPMYLSACDFGFLLRGDLLLNHVSSPTKFGEYLACGVPVIASPHIDDVKLAIERNHVGFIFRDDLHELEAFVRRVMRERSNWMGACSLFAREHYSWQAYGKALTDLYLDLVRRPGAKPQAG
jgi:glycosyltransferase involved in cell wall biosynthesis